MSQFKKVLLLIFGIFVTMGLGEVLTQSFVVRLGEMEELIQDQKQVIEDQKKMIQSFKTDAYFTVCLDANQAFPAGAIIKFDSIVSNVGGGYIDSGTDEGKFIAPVNGSYQFVVTVMNKDDWRYVAMDLMINGEFQCGTYAEVGAFQTGVCSVAVKLVAQDQVWVVNPSWGSPSNEYRGSRYSSFSGHLIHADV